MSNYVNKKIFLQLLVDYHQQPEPKPKIPEQIGKIFLNIAINYTNKSQCINYTQDRKDEIVSRMVFYMCKYIHSYNTTQGTSPFAYFTQIAKSQFLQYLNEQKTQKERYINLSFIENMDAEFEVIQDYYD